MKCCRDVFGHSWRGNPMIYPLHRVRADWAAQQLAAVRGPGAYFLVAQLLADYLEMGERVSVLLPERETAATALREWLLADLARLGYVPGTRPAAGSGLSLDLPATPPGGDGHHPLFGEFSTDETVGLWLQRGRHPSALFLSPHISTEGFDFTVAEYFDLAERLENLRRRYDRIPGVSAALNDLNTGFFRHRGMEESRAQIAAVLADFLAAAEELLADLHLAINGNARTTLFARRDDLNVRERDLAHLRNAARAAATLGQRKQRRALAELVERYRNYHRRWPASPLPPERFGSPDECLDLLEQERALIAAARPELSRQLRAENLSLSPLTAPDATTGHHLRDLADRLAALIQGIDEAGLYQLPVAATDAATTPRQLKLLEQVIQRLRNTQRHLAEFPAFYERRQLWYAQPAKLRRLLGPLVDLPAADWGNAFRAWYLERCLERSEDPLRPQLTEALSSATTEGLRAAAVARSRQPVGFGDLLRFGAAETAALTVDFRAKRPAAPPGGLGLWVAPLAESTATHLSVAGLRRPELVFQQFFQPIHPPEWSLAGRGDDPATVLELPPPGTLGREFVAEWPQLIFFSTRLRLRHAWTPEQVSAGLLSDGINADFLAAVLIRTAEAAAEVPFDRSSLTELGREVRRRYGIPEGARHPLAESLGELLQEGLPDHFLEIHYPWRDTLLPIVITAPTGRKTVLLPNGRPTGGGDWITDARRLRELAASGFRPLPVDTYAVWVDHRAEVRRLRELILA